MPIYPLPVLSEEEDLKKLSELQPPKTVVVRYGHMRQIGEFPYDGKQVIGCGTKLIVRTPRGVEMGEMLTTTCTNSGCGSSVSRQQMLDYIENSGGKQYPFTTNGRVMRIATHEDLNDQSLLDADKPRYIKAAKAAIKEYELPMKLVEVEPLFGRDKVVFYYASEDRIDFRDLVKQLASEIHVRIDMRQVGARDEARLVADYEKCGQHCCCKQFLKVLKPISMRSAKIQKATLDPQKISGRCGRLMCCLRYEDETYDALRKRLPHRKGHVLTDDGPGIVVSTQILTQLALVELDADRTRNAYPVESLRKYDEKAAEEWAQTQAEMRASAMAPPQPRRSSPPPPQQAAPTRETTPPETQEDDSAPRKRRRRRRKKGGSGDAQTPSTEPQRPSPGRPLADQDVESAEGQRSDQLPPTSGEAGDAAPKRRKRRRRRRKGPGSGGEGGSAPSEGGD